VAILIKAQSCLDISASLAEINWIYGAGATVCDRVDEKLRNFSDNRKFDFLR